MSNDDFWSTVNTQLDELTHATTAQQVVDILSRERCPLGQDVIATDADGFFAGSGGDRTVSESLRAAGWLLVWSEASYYWVMIAPDQTTITYIEGDIYLGNRAPISLDDA